MKSDRELLELAAKAAGYVVEPDAHIPSGGIWLAESDGDKPWNPLTDDGDALRLAATLLINVEPYEDYIFVESYSGPFANEFIKQNKGCRFLATRRAITRAAAAIGESMK